jgi:hypothetical protein
MSKEKCNICNFEFHSDVMVGPDSNRICNDCAWQEWADSTPTEEEFDNHPRSNYND